ncbi:hypothetical protein [Streptomyces sp. NPDC005209]
MLVPGRYDRLLPPELRPLTDALGFLPYGNGMHHDTDRGRRPLPGV